MGVDMHLFHWVGAVLLGCSESGSDAARGSLLGKGPGRGIRFQFRLDFCPDGPGHVSAHHQGEGDHTPSSLKKVRWNQGPGMRKAM